MLAHSQGLIHEPVRSRRQGHARVRGDERRQPLSYGSVESDWCRGALTHDYMVVGQCHPGDDSRRMLWRAEQCFSVLITQRSQVQILPPLPGITDRTADVVPTELLWCPSCVWTTRSPRSRPRAGGG